MTEATTAQLMERAIIAALQRRTLDYAELGDAVPQRQRAESAIESYASDLAWHYSGIASDRWASADMISETVDAIETAARALDNHDMMMSQAVSYALERVRQHARRVSPYPAAHAYRY